MEYFFVKRGVKGRLIKVVESEIVYIGADLNYVEIHRDHDCVITYLTLSELEGVLAPDSFLRVHKSFIVNLRKIIIIQSGSLVMANQTLVHIGAKYRERLEGLLAPLMVISKRCLL